MGLCGIIGKYLRGKVVGAVHDSKFKLHGYEIQNEVVGNGSFSKVIRATKNGVPVAVKIVDSEKSPEIFQENYVSREIDVLKKIRHKNIVEVLRIFDYPPKVYIFMELIEGPTLKQYILDNVRIEEDKARSFFQQLVDAFEYLHKKGISHRDLKPENVMIHQQVEVKLIDFGFAVLLVSSEDMSLACWGRSPYTAPETSQSTYDPLAIDIWSLGGVLFFMVNGLAPFSVSEEKLMEEQTSKSIAYPSNCMLSSSLKILINEMLEPNVTERLTIDQVCRSDWMQRGEKLRPVVSDNTNLAQDIDETYLLQES